MRTQLIYRHNNLVKIINVCDATFITGRASYR